MVQISSTYLILNRDEHIYNDDDRPFYKYNADSTFYKYNADSTFYKYNADSTFYWNYIANSSWH